MADVHRISDEAGLAAIYGEVNPLAILKEKDRITEDYRRFLEAAPFVVIASAGPEGLDCSPRGDPAGFVRIADDRTLMIPDRPGNNRLDTLRNILRDPRVALLFLIPGIGETMRVNGRAHLTSDPDLCESFAVNGRAARSVIVVEIEAIYFQCQKALYRSQLWSSETAQPRGSLPSTGAVLQRIAEAAGSAFDGQAYDDAYPERMERTAY